MCERTNAFRKAVIILAMGAHVVGVAGCLVHADEESASAGSADGGGGKNVGVALTFGSETVEIWCLDVFSTIAAEIKFHIFADQPENVGAFGFCSEVAGQGDERG